MKSCATPAPCAFVSESKNSMWCAAPLASRSNANAWRSWLGLANSCRFFRAMPLDAPESRLSVVKLGGSLALTPQCTAWLDILAKWGGPLILVPGGGPFADCVRKAQGAMGFDDLVAHRMALIAMGQYGMALAAHSDAFTLASACDEIDGALSRGKIPVWPPEKMVLAAEEMPASWDVTSDSLAASLGGPWC